MLSKGDVVTIFLLPNVLASCLFHILAGDGESMLLLCAAHAYSSVVFFTGQPF